MTKKTKFKGNLPDDILTQMIDDKTGLEMIESAMRTTVYVPMSQGEIDWSLGQEFDRLLDDPDTTEEDMALFHYKAMQNATYILEDGRLAYNKVRASLSKEAVDCIVEGRTPKKKSLKDRVLGLWYSLVGRLVGR